MSSDLHDDGSPMLSAQIRLAILALGAVLTPISVGAAPLSWPTIVLTQKISGLSEVTSLTHANDGSGRIFLVERKGKIRIFKNGALLTTPFIDLASKITSSGGEQGLLGLAFPANYKTQGRFYVYYTAPDGAITISRFSVSAKPDGANLGTEQVLLTIPHGRFSNHNGGQLAFSPKDGYLYAGTGDGGSGGDPLGNGQNTNALLGKILRLDVSAGTGAYRVPPTNPYVKTPGYRPEIWALGLRNPWRFSFDRSKGDLYIADVGQQNREEINFQDSGSPGGHNYGWNILEGTNCYNKISCTKPPKYIAPVWEYDHGLGCSVTGGYVYRGTTYPTMRGTFIYGDYCSGTLWGLKLDGTKWRNTVLLKSGLDLSTFGEDEAGNVYVVDYSGGKVYLIEAKATAKIER